MEGSSNRNYPRMVLDKTVEVEIGGRTVRCESPANNLSVGGVFLRRGDLPVGSSVKVRIVAAPPVEADGQICSSEPGDRGVGIGFTSVSDGNRVALDKLIEDLTLRGLPAA